MSQLLLNPPFDYDLPLEFAYAGFKSYLLVNHLTERYEMKKQLKAGQYNLKDWEIEKIIDMEPSFRNRLIIRLLAYCGMRRDEISNLKIDMIDRDSGKVTVIGKRKKLRSIPCEIKLLNDLLHWAGNRKAGFLFPAKIAHGRGIVPKQINVIVAAAADRAGIKHPDKSRGKLNPHLLRHSYAHRLKKAGVSMEAISAVMGHENINTTVKTYGLLSDDDIQEEINKKVFT